MSSDHPVAVAEAMASVDETNRWVEGKIFTGNAGNHIAFLIEYGAFLSCWPQTNPLIVTVIIITDVI